MKKIRHIAFVVVLLCVNVDSGLVPETRLAHRKRDCAAFARVSATLSLAVETCSCVGLRMWKNFTHFLREGRFGSCCRFSSRAVSFVHPLVFFNAPDVLGTHLLRDGGLGP